ncbi:MAG: hypothetical protein HDR50_12370 [Desulfovibrio sp.]|uniref:hypothetical protein n=1 Tax=Desulfovibrio sp. TaxID=885 RepID=UPI001A69FAB7|nr:hypothetical protein [Desulfovibrio sp.]MBD5418404.1 hypothetical protein [Desulfovibrio sp.]
MSGNSDKFFSWLGKISLVVGIVVGLFTLYHYSHPKDPKLYAQCFPLRVPLTPLESEFLKKNDKREDIKYSLKYFMQCTIMNSGDREASSVRIAIPADIISAKCTSDVAEIEYKKNFVEIKSLRPETSVKLDIWAEGFPSVTWKQLQLNSKEVSGKVDVGEIYYGVSASIANFVLFNINNPWFFCMILSLLILCTLLIIQGIKEEREKKRNSETKAAPDENRD